MKSLKIMLSLFLVLVISVSLSGCNKKLNNQNGWPNYEWELVIQWVGPEIAMEPTVEEWTLVLRWNFEYHTDHVFLKEWTWEPFFESENEYLPWNTVKFKWYVTALDAAAWNHYYEVVNVDELKLIANPDVNDIKEILESYNYCEIDDDCVYSMWECPFGCFVAFNKKFGDIPTQIMDNYFEINGKTCVYDCMYMDDVKCEDYKCVMKILEE